ncbi:MAG: ATP-dependent DNA helicase UvrD2, partial [Bifidobacteriaceae bacterium]|nr:ATP-dependent DNA helicase UvrD2 [Bifidobacteriaceae bacterium]
EQREVASTLLGPVCVLAGAGTGKTRAITHRIAYGVRTGTYSPAAVLAVTFTTRAAGEMRERLRALGAPGVQARTFHSAALRQIGYFMPRVLKRQAPRLIEHKGAVVAQAASRLGFEVDRAAVRDLAAEIEWAKVQMWTPEEYQSRAEGCGRGEVAGHGPIAIARLMSLYETVLAEIAAMDFEDVLLVAAGLLAEFGQVADQVRSQYRHFVVDEYQDVSPVQQRLLDLWLGDREELCVVGDPNQTIYSFTGASASHLIDFPKRHPEAPVIRLVRDYRSTPQVVSLANSLLRRSARSADDAGAGVELVAQRPPGPAVAFRAYADDVAEATGIARRTARALAQGVPAREVAVLFRTNGQSEPFETALGEAGIAFQVRGGRRFFTRPEVRQAVALLRSAARAGVDGPVDVQVRDALRAAGWHREPPAARGAARERWESLDALERLTRELARDGAATLEALVAAIAEREAFDHAPSAAGVTLASLHAAKGLEWDTVFLAGLSDGLVPISLAEGPEQIEEERRLLYVGITRARERLQLSYGAARTPGAAANRKPSRFLAGLWPSEGAVQARRIAIPEAGELTAQEAELFERLRAWRAAEAAAQSRPAYTVVPDVTLRAVAARRPATVRELAAIPGIGPTKIDRYSAALLAAVLDPPGGLAPGAGRGYARGTP